MAERLHFTDATSTYDAMVAAEHVVRYHCVRQLCRGRRVLDVACGEGYGSALLAGWGAAEVVGIDISAEAIAVARREFAAANITFIQGDACRLHEVLGDAPGFDLIVSFETIEHVSDVPGLLAGIRRYRAPHGTIVISCPNDHVEDADNPFHQRRYTLDEFRAVATAGLGPASGWLLGTPAQGQMLYAQGEPSLENRHDDSMRLLTQCQDLRDAAAIPAQPSTAPDAASCTFYLGYWGEPVGNSAVVAPQSHLTFVEPWRALNWFKQERERLQLDQQELQKANARLESRQDELRIAKAHLERQLADHRRRALIQAEAARQAAEEAANEAAKAAKEAEVHARALQQRLDRAQAELVPFRTELQQWVLFRQSRTYRLMQIYVRIYASPVAGPALRRLRRMAGSAWRRIRPR